MYVQKKTPVPQSPYLPPGSGGSSSTESFDVDLREALAATSVRELSFEEFRRALAKYGKFKIS